MFPFLPFFFFFLDLASSSVSLFLAKNLLMQHPQQVTMKKPRTGWIKTKYKYKYTYEWLFGNIMTSAVVENTKLSTHPAVYFKCYAKCHTHLASFPVFGQ